MCLVGNYQDNMLPAALRTSLDTTSRSLLLRFYYYSINAHEYLVVKSPPLESEWILYSVLNEANAPPIVVGAASMSPLLCHSYQVYCPFPEGRWSIKLYLLAFLRYACCEYLGLRNTVSPPPSCYFRLMVVDLTDVRCQATQGVSTCVNFVSVTFPVPV